MQLRLLTPEERRAKENVLECFYRTRDACNRGIARLEAELGIRHPITGKLLHRPVKESHE